MESEDTLKWKSQLKPPSMEMQNNEKKAQKNKLLVEIFFVLGTIMLRFFFLC